MLGRCLHLDNRSRQRLLPFWRFRWAWRLLIKYTFNDKNNLNRRTLLNNLFLLDKILLFFIAKKQKLNFFIL
jgi:hypothetical protein